MLTLCFLTLNAFANDDFLTDLEESIAQELAEDASEPAETPAAQKVVPPAAPSFEDELDFDITSDDMEEIVETPDIEINISDDINLTAVEGPAVDELTINAPEVEGELLNLATPDEIEANTNEKASELDWEFETDEF